MKATTSNGFALATSAAALFATISLTGCATHLTREQSAKEAGVSEFQEQYAGPARPCTVNVCGGHSDCR